MTNTSEEQSQTNVAGKSPKPDGRTGHKTIAALAIFALSLNAVAAVYTSPSDFAWRNINRLAELLTHKEAPAPQTVAAALSDIQSAQRQHLASLQEAGSSLQQNVALLQQQSSTIGSLRQSITDEHADVKHISAQIADEHADVKNISVQIADEHGDVKKMSALISTLITKVNSLQSSNALAITSSIRKGPTHARFMAHRKPVRVLKPAGLISLEGAPLTVDSSASAF